MAAQPTIVLMVAGWRGSVVANRQPRDLDVAQDAFKEGNLEGNALGEQPLPGLRLERAPVAVLVEPREALAEHVGHLSEVVFLGHAPQNDAKSAEPVDVVGVADDTVQWAVGEVVVGSPVDMRSDRVAHGGRLCRREPGIEEHRAALLGAHPAVVVPPVLLLAGEEVRDVVEEAGGDAQLPIESFFVGDEAAVVGDAQGMLVAVVGGEHRVELLASGGLAVLLPYVLDDLAQP
jgi:hypothetical protein